MPCLLVVDDDASILRLLSAILAEDYHVVTTQSGESALEIIDGGLAVDGAVLDVMMGRMDGFQLARALRDRPSMAGIPIVMLTVLDNAQHHQRALDAGADAFLTKPFEPALLEATLSLHVPRGTMFP